MPVPLAGYFVSPPVRTGASGHAWVSVDNNCHLHYEIVVAGLSKTDDLTVSAHLHGLAEIGELDDSSTTHKRLLTGFYGSQVRQCEHRRQPVQLDVHKYKNHRMQITPKRGLMVSLLLSLSPSGSGSLKGHWP